MLETLVIVAPMIMTLGVAAFVEDVYEKKRRVKRHIHRNKYGRVNIPVHGIRSRESVLDAMKEDVG